ncbi:MAG: ComEC/Rec2 family competence protein [Eubacteriales bacterium]
MKKNTKHITLRVIILAFILFCIGICLPRNAIELNLNDSYDENINVNTTNGTTLLIHFFDIGQADSIFIQEPSGKTMLIDAGNEDDSSYIIQYLKYMDINEIDYLVATHPHEDHIGGMDDIVTAFNVGMILAPKVLNNSQSNKDLHKAINKKEYTITYTKAGDHYNLGECNFTIASPWRDTYTNLNDYSLVLKLNYYKNSFLFMGDAEGDVLGDMLSAEVSLESDLIKIGHHGAAPSTPDKLIKAVKAKTAILTVRNNKPNYPHLSTLSTLENNHVDIYQTAGQGTVVVSSDGKNIHVSRSKIINKDKASLKK